MLLSPHTSGSTEPCPGGPFGPGAIIPAATSSRTATLPGVSAQPVAWQSPRRSVSSTGWKSPSEVSRWLATGR